MRGRGAKHCCTLMAHHDPSYCANKLGVRSFKKVLRKVRCVTFGMFRFGLRIFDGWVVGAQHLRVWGTLGESPFVLHKFTAPKLVEPVCKTQHHSLNDSFAWSFVRGASTQIWTLCKLNTVLFTTVRPRSAFVMARSDFPKKSSSEAIPNLALHTPRKVSPGHDNFTSPCLGRNALAAR